MEKTKLKYYRIQHLGIIARGCSRHNWIWDHGAWQEDTENIVWDRLCGYDSSEPPGSPYGFGSTSVMDEIEEISYEEAMDLIAQKIISDLIRKWKEKFKEAKKEWDENPKRAATYAEMSFILFDAGYVLTPEDLKFEKGPEDGGFMESIQKELEKDLAAAGASEIGFYGNPVQ